MLQSYYLQVQKATALMDYAQTPVALALADYSLLVSMEAGSADYSPLAPMEAGSADYALGSMEAGSADYFQPEQTA
jgi:hypothetical protein